MPRGKPHPEHITDGVGCRGGFVPYSPLGRGFLTGTLRSSADLNESSDFRRNLPRFSDDARETNLAVVDVSRAIADEREATAAQVALAWLRYRADEFGVQPYRSRVPAVPRVSRRISARWTWRSTATNSGGSIPRPPRCRDIGSPTWHGCRLAANNQRTSSFAVGTPVYLGP